ncbi:MAG: DnaJ domain-containing protein [Candidatus Nanoarchaeia archaeon]
MAADNKDYYEKDFYDILNIPEDATLDEIKKAYRDMSKILHPDVNRSKKAEAKMKDVNRAYEVLSDSLKRADYNAIYAEQKKTGFSKKEEKDEKKETKRETKLTRIVRECIDNEDFVKAKFLINRAVEEKLKGENIAELNEELRDAVIRSKSRTKMKTALEHYRKQYGDDLIFDNKNYLVFKNRKDEESRFLHISIFERHFRMPRKYLSQRGLQVHHIDACRWNPEIWNLVALTKQQHNRVEHTKIVMGDWKGGVKALMDALNWTEHDLPQHIKAHYNEVKYR